MDSRSNFRLSLPLVWFIAVGGCYIGLDASEDGADGEGGGDEGETDALGEEGPAPAARVARLTHLQWENTIRDLFYLGEAAGFGENFRADPAQSGFIFDNAATSLEVDQALWSAYRGAALEIAEMVAADAEVFAAIVPADGGDASVRAQAFVEEFGARAYRRPLAPDEVAALLGQFDEAPELYPGEDPFVAGVRMVIETVLQSPYFLYRIETSAEPDGDVIPLDGYEVATRLSYALWNTMPDDALFEAAAADELLDAEGVEAQARRMLADPRAAEAVSHFHDQLLEVGKFDNIAPSDAFFPDASSELGAYAKEEQRRFVQDVVFEQGGGWAELLTATGTYVNAELARIYGLEGEFGDEFVWAELDPAERRGIFTHVGFLASNATSVNPDPIHRGVFIAERITCMQIAAPPDGVPPLPPVEGKSNRQTVEEHTQAPGTACVSCHQSIINPFGFAFENYDASGAWRTEDNGFQVDASSEVLIGGETVPITNALDLVQALSESEVVHRCYAEHWLQYAHGRPSHESDDALVHRLGTASLEEGLTVEDLLVELVTSPAFLTRSTEELP